MTFGANIPPPKAGYFVMSLKPDKIKVVNSRTRDEEQFTLNVRSIESVGQVKDIRVNDKYFAKTGFYELICGEGGRGPAISGCDFGDGIRGWKGSSSRRTNRLQSFTSTFNC